MKTVVITKPDFYSGEAEDILRQLDFGAERVHIRKPGAAEADMRRLLDAIPIPRRNRLALHDCHNLATEYGIETLHLNGRNPHVPDGWTGRVGVSCHSIAELSMHPDADYMFLSPVFDSISKPGYMATFSADALQRADLSKVYALGGVSGSRLAELEALGFCGAAMLGAAWSPVCPDRFRLQFITHANDRYSTVEGAEMALEGGCRWIQLRMKGASADEVRAAAGQIRPMCR
ncbi:MAG: thiamine phosphate synthase, partial [Muribaculaceae bacterium]|nr:thiamine phosphate synthase [Muribaculaceae bacterium]